MHKKFVLVQNGKAARIFVCSDVAKLPALEEGQSYIQTEERITFGQEMKKKKETFAAFSSRVSPLLLEGQEEKRISPPELEAKLKKWQLAILASSGAAGVASMLYFFLKG